MNFTQCKVALRSWIIMSLKSAVQQRALLVFMEGKYSRNWSQDDFENIETVKIKQISGSNDIYKIIKIWWKQDDPDKDMFHKQKVDKWLATYDYSKRQLSEIGGKRRCSFLPENEVMFINAAKFEKIECLQKDYIANENELI